MNSTGDLNSLAEATTDSLIAPVVIVGAGPAGLAAAYELARNSFRSTTIENGQSADGSFNSRSRVASEICEQILEIEIKSGLFGQKKILSDVWARMKDAIEQLGSHIVEASMERTYWDPGKMHAVQAGGRLYVGEYFVFTVPTIEDVGGLANVQQIRHSKKVDQSLEMGVLAARNIINTICMLPMRYDLERLQAFEVAPATETPAVPLEEAGLFKRRTRKDSLPAK